MRDVEYEVVKRLIDEATVVSFDVFDTLLFRKVNTPETIFDLVGKHFGIHGFRKLRMDGQNEASHRVYEKYEYPHANINEIYEVLAEHTEILVDWDEVKEFELQMENDALVANKEMLEIFHYAKSVGKRVVATSDMYLLANTLQCILEKNGYIGVDYVYCSADEHKAKFNQKLFKAVAQKEGVSFEEILHIGDNKSADVEIPASFGIKTYFYNRNIDVEKIKNVLASDIDKGLYKILCDEERGFWYNLGIEVGGPLYMALYIWITQKIKNWEKKIYFLSRDGYNLYKILKNAGYNNIEYLYTSRRSLVLAGITEMNKEDIELLPPYTTGQTVGEILDYLCIPNDAIMHLKDVGFHSFSDVIRTSDQIVALKKIYELDKDVFLARCEIERKNAVKYFSTIGFLHDDAIVFDCGWNGSSQYLIERFKKAIECTAEISFCYFGIRNTEKSRRQLHGLHYDTFLFDFYKNYALQSSVDEAVVMYELFFSAPHESVYYYEESEVVFESGKGDPEKSQIFEGILDYLSVGFEFVKKYDVDYSTEMAVGRLQRLIMFPTEEEAVKIGNLENVDGFARKQGEHKYIAYITEQQLKNNPQIEIYWIRGLLKRNDISENLKQKLSLRYGIEYPEVEKSKYHLEDGQSIRNYYRWIQYQNEHFEKKIKFSYQPMFSVVIPVYNTETQQLKECIDSVLMQSYENFELILVDDYSSWDNVVPVLKSYENHKKVCVIYRTENGHISVATNNGIDVAQGEFTAFMDCDDIIEPDALYEMAKKLNENSQLDFIYSDEDKITEDGKVRHLPFFKPDWSPDLFMCMMYTNHLAVYRTSIVREIGGLRSAYNGSQDYDFTLRFMEKSENQRVGHISKVLYHWRERKESVAYAMTSKNYATEAARHAKEDWIRRNNIEAHLEYISGMSQYRTIYKVVGNPLVSIIIPSKDNFQILKQCIDSIYEFTAYKNFEVIVVDNGSDDTNRMLISEYLRSRNNIYIYEKEDFNFSRMCNRGARQAVGEYLLFLNDDVEAFQPEWLERMVGQAQRYYVGAVGAKLFYPQTTKIQHTGIGNIKEGPNHNFGGYDDTIPYYFGFNWIDYNCIAVTGACMLISVSAFWEVSGFDETLPVAYNDVHLCFSLHEAGYYNVIRNDAVLFHHESLSRGYDYLDDVKLLRWSQELNRLYMKFPNLKQKDPFLNPNIYAYKGVLETSYMFDNLESCNLSEVNEGGCGNIDTVEITDKIRVLGWSYLEGNENVIRYLILMDPFGNCYRTSILPVLRQDVSDCFGDGIRYQYAGFECILDRMQIRMDIMPYKIGVLSYDVHGKKIITWLKISSEVVRSHTVRPMICSGSRIDSIIKCDKQTDVQWYIDYIQKKETYYEIRGFVFCVGDMHFQYQKSLVLVDNNNVAYEFEVYNEERIDVAVAFPEQHFLYNTGFKCYILNDALEGSREYDVIIRLRNQFEQEDIEDIVTGQKIIVA